MKHLGDITKINGAKVPVVDVVVGGSPCQDLSIAGAGKGLAGSRSSLFLEQIRIIKEMRENDMQSGRTGSDVRPRYMVWENVPGALSCHGGEDFRIVLEETASIADKTASVPRPKKWATSGCILADGWSIAWRVHDAQFWGVPQRRRRIALIADFGGQSAPEILFERNGLRGDSSKSKEQREGTSSRTENGVGSTVYCLQGNGIDRADTAGCNGKGWRKDVSYTLNTIYDARGNGNGNIAPTITGDHESRITDYTAITFAMQNINEYKQSDTSSSIYHRDYKSAKDLIVTAVDCENGTENESVNGTLQAHTTGGSSINLNNVVRTDRVVRRLTPMECERLQGFPDGYTDIGDWTDSKGKTRKTTDSARYKALGNSIALPFWRWMLTRLCNQYIRPASMASLFDGIGGFPYLWEQINGRGSCTWASEVDEFCIAVTEKRINRNALNGA